MSNTSNNPVQTPLELIAQRLQKLEDLDALNKLQTRYTKAVDAKYTAEYELQRADLLEKAAAEQAACFTEDGIWDGGITGDVVQGQEALREIFKYVPWKYAFHSYQTPDITIDGDTASGTWSLWEIAVTREDSRTLLIYGNAYERYRRTAQGWRIAYMRFDLLDSITLSSDAQAIVSLLPSRS